MVGYLSPDGIMHECAPWEHGSKAFEICEGIEDIQFVSTYETTLMNLGYLVLRARDAYMSYWHSISKLPIFLTEKQIEWIDSHIDLFPEAVKKDIATIISDQTDREKRYNKKRI